MARNKLQPFLSPAFAPRSEHGGELRRGKRKLARPLDPKRPLHVVMRASSARGGRSLLSPAHARRVDALVQRFSRRFGVRMMSFANVGNHLHLLVQGRDRKALQNFLRVLPGQIAQAVTGARKGDALETRFWDSLVFSRVVEWGRALDVARRYLAKNKLEGTGLIARSEIDRIFGGLPLARGGPASVA